MTTLGQLARDGVLEFSDGYRTRRDQHADAGFRILRAGDVRDGRIYPDGPDFVGQGYAPAIGAKAARAGDVVLTTKGTVGRTGRVTDHASQVVYSPQLCFFRSQQPGVLDMRFFYHWLSSPQFIDQAGYLKSASDMAPYISLKDLASTRIQLPPLTTQLAIAEVLGALDDKIAANARVAAAAVNLADSEYQFARRQSSLVESTFGAVCSASGGGTPSTKVPEFWDGDIPWVTPTDVTALSSPYIDRTARQITEKGLTRCSSALYPVDSILMTSRATIGAFALAKTPVAVNQGFIVAEARDREAQLWLFHEMRSRVDDFLAHANGATFLELNKARFRGIEVLWPDDPGAFRQFSRRVAHLHDRAYAATVESRALANLRDRLLPHLMSGRLSVRGAEEAVEEVL